MVNEAMGNHEEDPSLSPRGLSCYYSRKSGHKKSKYRFLKRDQKAGTVHATQIDPKKNEGGTIIVGALDDENVVLIDNEN